MGARLCQDTPWKDFPLRTCFSSLSLSWLLNSQSVYHNCDFLRNVLQNPCICLYQQNPVASNEMFLTRPTFHEATLPSTTSCFCLLSKLNPTLVFHLWVFSSSAMKFHLYLCHQHSEFLAALLMGLTLLSFSLCCE